jgi:hypothetical protein
LMGWDVAPCNGCRDQGRLLRVFRKPCNHIDRIKRIKRIDCIDRIDRINHIDRIDRIDRRSRACSRQAQRQ